MTLVQVEELMLMGDMNRCMDIFHTHCLIQNIFDSIKQYDPKLHDIHDPVKRPDKTVNDDKGNLSARISVARISLPIQKKITTVAAAFLGYPCTDATPEEGKETDLFTMVNEIWDANKLDYKFRGLAKKVMSERHCAELWYTQDVDQSYWDGYPINANFKLSMRLLANSLGDWMYPVFDEYGNMIAFGRSYFVITVVDNQITPQKIMHFDVYTADQIWESKKLDNAWLFTSASIDPKTNSVVKGDYSPGVTSIPNIIGKIPVIYYSQPITEWHDVQEMIDRLEKKTSNHADTDDYFDSPIIIAKGKIIGFTQKGETGKLLEAENGADVSYLTWDQAPASMKLEIDNLWKYIHSFTHTPDISFENMKGLGVFSGIALKMLFLDAHLKASDKEEIFGEGVQRRINYLKKAISVIDASFVVALPLNIKPKFEYFLPENTAEQIDVLVKAYGSGIMSQQTAIEQNPLVEDAQVEQDRIQTEGPITVDPTPVPLR